MVALIAHFTNVDGTLVKTLPGVCATLQTSMANLVKEQRVILLFAQQKGDDDMSS